MHRLGIALLVLGVISLWSVVSPTDKTVSSAPFAQNYTQITVNCSRPVLDVMTGQPVMWGNIPWYVEAGDTILSHEWDGRPRYEYGGKVYHYLGSISGPARFFIVEECTQPAPAVPVRQPAPQTIRLADDTYVYLDNNNTTNTYSSFFVVTSEGVIVGNPNGNAGAPRLKAAIEAVTSQPVRYVVYTHASPDHDTGAGIFRDTATYISHTNAKGPIASRNNPDSPAPERTFDDRMTLSLGGVQLDLRYAGRNHSDSTIVIAYPARRVAVIGDLLYAHDSLPFGPRAEGDYVSEWIEGLRRLEAMGDIDTVVPGHGGPAPKSLARDIREYFGDLVVAIEESERQGKVRGTPRQLEFVRTLLYPKYGGWSGFGPNLPTNVQGMYINWDQLGRFSNR